ncbi:MAG TPA: hypothetical protein P5274_02085 [Candidatus Paceibacterota bacterium]|nr:hypothetical protein [Candidatus Paceibacterota bacterium]
MNSHLIITVKKIVVLTLIVGFFVMPVTPILAEEIVAPVSEPIVEVVPAVEATPIVEVAPVAEEPIFEIVPEIVECAPEIELVAEASEEVIILEEVTEEVVAEAFIEEAIVEEVSAPAIFSKIAPITSAVDFAEENNFTTVSDPIIIVDEETSSLASELSFVTESGDPIVNPELTAISAENSFTTANSIDVTEDDVTIGTENSFTTLNDTIDNDNNISVSTENSFTTLNDTIDTDDDIAVSAEKIFTTLDNSTEDNTTVSEENTFTTLDNFNDDNTAVSGENSFTTLRGDDDDTDPAVSDEQSFTTLDNSTEDNTTVSEEMSFSTLDNGTGDPDSENTFTTLSDTTPPVNPPGGGGGGGSSGGYVLAQQTYTCGILLHKFIKYGQANDRLEVIKLQIFLRVFEGFTNLKVTGIYDLPTYRAVEIFQKRYTQDVLSPWGITDSTGYVFITTRLAINNIFCGRSTANDLDLRNFYREYELATGETFILTPVLDDDTADGGYTLTPATTTEATTTEATSTPVVKRNWLMAGLGGLLDFIGDNLCWLLNLLLLLIIFFLLWLLWITDQDDDNNFTEGEDESLKGHIANGDLGLIGAVALDEIMSEDDKLVLDALAEEEDSQIPAANNDPDQNAINL